MRRACIVAMFVAAWMIGPVVRIQDAPQPGPQPAPSVSVTISR
jgi:hypothetical protein